jgi:ATP-binding cassette subfamily B protein
MDNKGGTMITYLMKRLALSRQGAVDFIKSVTICTLTDCIMMIPVGLLYLIIAQLLPATVIGRSDILPGGYKPRGPMFFIVLITAVFIVLYIVNYLKYNGQYLSTYKESRVRRMSLAEKMRKLPLSFFGKKDLAALTATIMADCALLETAFSHWLPLFWGSIFSTIIISVCLFFFNVKMACAAVWVVPIAFVIVYTSRKIQMRAGKKQFAAQTECADGIQECLETVRDLKANNAEDSYLAGLDEKIHAVEKTSIWSEIATAVFVITAQMILKLGIVTTALTGGLMLVNGEISLLMFITFMIVISRFYDPLNTSLQNLAAIISAEKNLARMREIDSQPVQAGTTAFTPHNFDIEFEHVGFAYHRNETVLKDVSFTARQGEVTALIGPSGGGKSTAAKLASRFWDAQQGIISVSGIPVSGIDPETLLSSFSIVFQDVTLFNNTVMENIRIGKNGATDEEVRTAARKAQCDEFVDKLPQKYETIIGENGSMLSGGERQRISIARALLKDAPIILLDEATASLDTENETKVQQAISGLIKDKTVIVIAHRMRTIEGADHIVLLKDGIVAEDGRPDDLCAADGWYAKMVRMQGTE